LDRSRFIPDLHSKIIAFSDYRATDEAPRIYNLTGTFVKKSQQGDK
jgi:hypothetical protein